MVLYERTSSGGLCHHGVRGKPPFWFQQTAGRFLRGTDALPRICGDRYSKAFGPHRGDTLGRSCAALPLPQCSGAAARSARPKRYSAAGTFRAAGTGAGAFWLHVPAGRPAAFVPRDSGGHGRHLRVGQQDSAGTTKKKQNGRSFRLGFRVRNDPSPLTGSPVLFEKGLFQELLTLPQGMGGSVLLRKYPAHVHTVYIADRNELADADTPEALAQLEALARQKL